MKGKKIVALGLCAAMLLSNGAVAQAAQAEARASVTLGDKVTVGETEFSYDVVLPEGYDANAGKSYPTIYVMPEDGIKTYPENIAEQMNEVMKGNNGVDSILVFPEFTEDCDFREVTEAIVADVDETYATIADASARAVVGTEIGGYMAYVQTITDKDEETGEYVVSNEPTTFASVASICGDFVSEDNIWYEEGGDVYSYLSTMGGKNSDAYTNYYTYLDCATEHEYSAMTNSTNDIGSMFIGWDSLMSYDIHEYTARYGTYDAAFLKESIKRVVNRFSKEFTAGMCTGSFTITPQVAASSVKEITGTYTVNVSNLYGKYTEAASAINLIVTMTDPETGNVLDKKIIEKEMNAGSEITGTVALPNTVNGLSTTITLSVEYLGFTSVIGSQNLVRIQDTGTAPDEQLVDLMGDWHFNAYKAHNVAEHEWDDIAKVTKDVWSQWEIVQPALGWWSEGFGSQTLPHQYWGGWAYYIREFELPADFSKDNLILAIGKIDEADQVFVNGVLVGSTGVNEDGTTTDKWDADRVYDVDSDILNYGGTNVVAVRMYNANMGGGGWYEGPVGIYTQAAYNKATGIPSTPASEDVANNIKAFVTEQNQAIMNKDITAYGKTVDAEYFHRGYDRERLLEKVTGYITGEKEVKVEDTSIYVFEVDGSYMYQADRVITKADGTTETVAVEDYYTVNGEEIVLYGDHARFFADTYESIYGASAQKLEAESTDMIYRVYLPDGYFESDKRYPVVYLLHQFSSTSKSYEIDGVQNLLEEGIASGDIRDTIVVMPDSAGQSWWTGDWEKMVTEDLMPFINETYRTIDDARFTGTAGCSMGGLGAYSVALRNPDLFTSAISFFGAFSYGTWFSINPANVINAESAAYADYYTHYFICGNQDSYGFGSSASALDDALRAKGVDHMFLIENGEHNSVFYLPHFIEAFSYVSRNMYSAPETITKTVNGGLNVVEEDGKVTITANVNVADSIKNYLNTVPASSYTKEANPDMVIPVVLKIEQNGKTVYSQTDLTKAVNGATSWDVTAVVDYATETTIDETKDYTVTAIASVLDKNVTLGTFERAGNQDDGNQGSGDQDNGNQGSGDQDNGNQGSGDQDNGNQGSGNQNNGNQGGGNQDNGNQGSGDQNNGNQGSGDQNDEESTGIKVEGVTSNVAINVTEIKKDTEAYQQIEEAVTKGYTLLGVINIELAEDPISESITVTIPVGDEYNGRKAIVYHIKADDNTMEKFDVVVKDGKVSVKVSSLSPFGVAIADASGNGNQNNTAGGVDTSDSNNVVLYILVLMLGLVVMASGIYKRKHA